MLGEFLGMTGAMSALAELDSFSIIRLSSVMNNPLDVKRLRKFKEEVLYLCDFLNNKVKTEYESPQIRRLLRQIDLIRDGKSDTLLRSYKCDISNLDVAGISSLVGSIQEQIKDIVRETGGKKSVINSFTKDDGTVVSLGTYELLILENFKTYYYRVLEGYAKLVQVSSFRELTVFNERLHRVNSLGPSFLLASMERLFDVPSPNKERIKALGLEAVQVIKAHFREDGNVSGAETGQVDQVIKAIDFRKYLLSNMGLDTNRIGLGEAPAIVEELHIKFLDESKEFISVLESLAERKLLSAAVAYDIIQLYYKVFRLDNDMIFLCEQLFPEDSPHLLTRQEVLGVFNRLNEIGFFMFNLSGAKLMVDNLRKLSFSSESKTVIDPDFEKYGLTFRRVVDDIEALCLSMVPPGTLLEEV